MDVTLELINGIKLGIEHINCNEDENEECSWAIVIDIFVVRIGVLKYKQEEE